MVLFNVDQSANTMLILLSALSVVCLVSSDQDLDLGLLFGKDIDADKAWDKLFELQQCSKPSTLDGTIIMVNESLMAGGKYLTKPEVSSKYECEFECCYSKKKDGNGCNIAVYAEEENHCYLFACGVPSKCRFDTHEGYSVTLIGDVDVTNGLSTPAVTSPTTSPSFTTNPAPKKLELLAGCRQAVDECVVDNSECSNSGLCLCKTGFHAKNGVCRKDCLASLEFECINGNAKYTHPDCIAIYDVCDGTPQCPDQSDESGCDQVAQESKKPDIKPVSSPPHTAPATKPAAAASVSIHAADQLASAAEAKTKDQPTSELVTEVKSETVPELVEQKSSNSTREQTENEAAVGAAVLSVQHGDDIVSTTSARSAIVALSLCLALTLLLIIYLAARYRNMRKRLTRSGKPIRGSEVDYLIDGMYM